MKPLTNGEIYLAQSHAALGRGEKTLAVQNKLKNYGSPVYFKELGLGFWLVRERPITGTHVS